MLYSIAMLTPCFMCLIWCMLILLSPNRSRTQTLLTWVAGLASIYFYLGAAFLSPDAGYETMVYLDMGFQVVAFTMAPTLIFYLRSMLGKRSKGIIATISYAPSLIMGTAAVSIYTLMGVENAASFLQVVDNLGRHPAGYQESLYMLHQLVTVDIYNTLLLLELLVCAGYCIYILIHNEFRIKDIFLFFHRGRASSPINITAGSIIVFFIVASPLLIYTRSFLLDHMAYTAISYLLISMILFVVFYIGLNFQATKVTLKDLGSPSEREDVIDDEFLDLGNETENPAQYVTNTKASLFEKFNRYIQEEEPFLKPDLTIEDVAEALSSNRTYISVMMKESFSNTFRGYINSLRIERAKKLLLERPDELLNDIAEMSGFSSDSQLVKKFNDVEGCSPRVWLKRQTETE